MAPMRRLARVISDSRALEPGALFVALAGERFDGHDFVADAAQRGAAGAIVSRPVDCALPQVVVADTLAGLAAFANAWRRAFAGVVVGITGSNGKTTVKEMTGAILAELRSVPRDAGQPQQPHRRAAHAVPARSRASLRRHRDGREPPGRNRAPGRDRRADGRPGDQCRPGAPRRIRRHRRRRQGQGRDVRSARAGRHGGDQRRRSLRRVLARARARRAGRVVTFGLRERADVTARDVRSHLGVDGFRDDVRTGHDLRQRDPSSWASPANTTS